MSNPYRQQEMDQAAAQMGISSGRSNKDVHLTEDVARLIIKEREREAEELRQESKLVSEMSPEEYLRRGINIATVRSFDLAGRLAKKGVDSVSYDPHQGSWRFHGHHTEYHRPVREVEELLGCSTETGSEDK